MSELSPELQRTIPGWAVSVAKAAGLLLLVGRTTDGRPGRHEQLGISTTSFGGGEEATIRAVKLALDEAAFTLQSPSIGHTLRHMTKW